MSNEKPYCIMPWIHLHVGQKGVVKACCVANIPYGNINHKSLDEIWTGDKINKIRSMFLKGESDNRCAQCINIEATGGKSIRLETLEKYGHLDLDTLKTPVYFDIRFSNVCNFKCRTCWHGASSKWFNDAKALGRNVGDKAIIKNIHDFKAFIRKTGPALLKAKEIYFAGGEPLVTEEHYLLLDWLINNGATKMLLRYNTNFSVLKFKGYDVLSIWQHFDNVEILASIDGFGDLGEYIRREMDWTRIVANRKLIDEIPNITFKIAPTISVYNMKHLPDLYKKCIELKLINPLDFYINILERPSYFNIQIFSKEEKIIIEESYHEFYQWCDTNNIHFHVKSQFEECIQYMKGKDQSNLWPFFEKENSLIDEM